MIFNIIYYHYDFSVFILGLGIYKSIYEKLESACHKIDTMMYKAMVNEDDEPITTSENNFKEAVKADVERNESFTNQISTLEEDLVDIQQELPMQLSEHSLIDGDVDVESGDILNL